MTVNILQSLQNISLPFSREDNKKLIIVLLTHFVFSSLESISIARALFTKQRILVIDEATSVLDGETESDIANTIKSLLGKTTLLIVGHRFSPIKNIDQVISLSSGSTTAKGKFIQVKQNVPEFNRQKNLVDV